MPKASLTCDKCEFAAEVELENATPAEVRRSLEGAKQGVDAAKQSVAPFVEKVAPYLREGVRAAKQGVDAAAPPCCATHASALARVRL